MTPRIKTRPVSESFNPWLRDSWFYREPRHNCCLLTVGEEGRPEEKTARGEEAEV